jgi:hypothetical protein
VAARRPKNAIGVKKIITAAVGTSDKVMYNPPVVRQTKTKTSNWFLLHLITATRLEGSQGNVQPPRWFVKQKNDGERRHVFSPLDGVGPNDTLLWRLFHVSLRYDTFAVGEGRKTSAA